MSEMEQALEVTQRYMAACWIESRLHRVWLLQRYAEMTLDRLRDNSSPGFERELLRGQLSNRYGCSVSEVEDRVEADVDRRRSDLKTWKRRLELIATVAPGWQELKGDR